MSIELTPRNATRRRAHFMLVQGTHHVDDLLQRDAEGEHERLRLVDDRPLEVVVRPHQVAQQLLLVVAAYRLCKGKEQVRGTGV